MPRQRTIRGSIGLIIAGLLVPLLAVQAAIYFDRYRMAYEGRRRGQLDTARATAAGVGSWLRDLRKDLEAIADTIVEGVVQRPDEARTLLGLMAHGHPAVFAVSYVSPQGEVLRSNRPEREGKPFDDPALVTRTLSAGEWTVAPLHDGARAHWAFALPVHHDGMRGVLVACVDTSKLGFEELGIARIAQSHIAVLDGDDTVLFREPDVSIWAGHAGLARSELAREALRGRFGAGTVRGPGSAAWILAAAPVEGAAWAALAAQPRADVVHAAVNGLVPHALAFLLTAVFATILAYFVADRVAGPLRALERSTRAFGEGELDRRVKPLGPLEVERLGESFNRMADHIGSLLEQIEHRAAELDRLLGQREDLLHAVSHDLRTPLSAVTLQAQVLRRMLVAGGGEEKALRSVDHILVGCRRMDTMIGDLVDHARFEVGQLRLRPVDVDLGRFLRTLLERLSGVLDVGRIQVEVPDETPSIRIDPDRLERVVVNLVSNALRYADPSTPVRVRLEKADAEVVLSVADRGRGLSEEEIAGLFRKFHRLAATQAKAPGLGLGLYITRTLVEAQGGRVWVESVPGEGSTFFAAFPVRPPGDDRSKAPETG